MPGTYQSFQHFITHAPWSAERVWRRLRHGDPRTQGVLILDGTSFPKQGPHSVGVARQYCGSLGKVANCQVAVTTALWTGYARMDAECRDVSPRGVADVGGPTACANSRAPCASRRKWRLALTQLRQIRASGFHLTAVVGDAEFADNATLRRALRRAKLPYALGVSSDLKVFSRDAAPHTATAVAGRGPGAHSARAGARRAHGHGRRPGGRTARARLAARQLAQRRERPLAGGILSRCA